MTEFERVRRVRNLKALAKESDRDFTHRLEELASQYLEIFLEDALVFLENLKQTPSKLPPALVFIPIQHFNPVDPEERVRGKQLAREVFRMLNNEPPIPTLIAAGESTSKPYNKSRLHQETQQLVKRARELGFPPEISQSLQRPREAYEYTICDITARASGAADAFGVDSDVAKDIASLYLLLSGISPSREGEEIYQRFGTEARTRAALNQATMLVGPEQRLIFIQGFMHVFGVEEWCRRNSVELELRVPAVVQSSPDYINFLSVQ